MAERPHAIVADALRQLDVQTEAILRSLLPLAGRLACPRCTGAGAVLGPIEPTVTERGFTLSRRVTRCTCTTIARPRADAAGSRGQ